MARKSSTKSGESPHARRIQIRLERVAHCTDVYNAAFRAAVEAAWKLYQDGGPIVRRRCGLLSLLKEADKVWAIAVKSLRGGVLVGPFPYPWPTVCRVCKKSLGSAHSLSCAFSGDVGATECKTDWEVCTCGTVDGKATPCALHGWCVGCRCDTCASEDCINCPIHKGSCWDKPQGSPDLADLRGRLTRLERVPENEGVRMELETEIFNLENALGDDEWPDVIGGFDA